MLGHGTLPPFSVPPFAWRRRSGFVRTGRFKGFIGGDDIEVQYIFGAIVIGPHHFDKQPSSFLIPRGFHGALNRIKMTSPTWALFTVPAVYWIGACLLPVPRSGAGL